MLVKANYHVFQAACNTEPNPYIHSKESNPVCLVLHHASIIPCVNNSLVWTPNI